MEDDKPIVSEIEDDKASNNGCGSTASHSSEEFVKVNQDDASLDGAIGDIPREDLEDLTPVKDDTAASGFGERLMGKIDPRVIDLIYWRDIKNTAAVFSFLLVTLVSLLCHSVISVVAYAALAVLTVTVGFRLYRLVLQTLNGTQQPHPFQGMLDIDMAISPERAEKYAKVISCHMNCYLSTIRDLLLVKETINSLKFGVFLWLLTYIGAVFNGLTLIITAVIVVFSVPPIYEKYQTQIDGYCGIVNGKVTELVAKVKAKLPGKKEKEQ